MESTSSRIPASWLEIDCTLLELIVPLLASIDREIADVSWLTTVLSAESLTCSMLCVEEAVWENESSLAIWALSSTFSPAATGSSLSEFTRDPLASSSVSVASLEEVASSEPTSPVM
jgi:hypothetical protein